MILLRSRRWFSRQLFVSHRSVVNKRRHDRCCLLHIVALDSIKNILIRMMSSRIVFDLILNELETR
jgi:hypothetical protein